MKLPVVSRWPVLCLVEDGASLLLLQKADLRPNEATGGGQMWFGAEPYFLPGWADLLRIALLGQGGSSLTWVVLQRGLDGHPGIFCPVFSALTERPSGISLQDTGEPPDLEIIMCTCSCQHFAERGAVFFLWTPYQNLSSNESSDAWLR